MLTEATVEENYDWTRRVDQATATSAHEQLREYIREAHEAMERFRVVSAEQGGLLLDAQRELEARLDGKLAALREDVFNGVAAIGEELDAEAKRLRDQIGGNVSGIEARLTSLEARINELRHGFQSTRAALEEQTAAVVAQLERLNGMEERATARMVEVLASAFVQLRDGKSNSHSNGTASNGYLDSVSTVG